MRFKNLLPSAQNCKWKSALSRLDSLVHYIPTSKQFYHSSLSAFFELPQFPSFPPPKISKQSTEATVRRHLREKRRSKKWTQFSVVNPSLSRAYTQRRLPLPPIATCLASSTLRPSAACSFPYPPSQLALVLGGPPLLLSLLAALSPPIPFRFVTLSIRF